MKILQNNVPKCKFQTGGCCCLRNNTVLLQNYSDSKKKMQHIRIHKTPLESLVDAVMEKLLFPVGLLYANRWCSKSGAWDNFQSLHSPRCWYKSHTLGLQGQFLHFHSIKTLWASGGGKQVIIITKWLFYCHSFQGVHSRPAHPDRCLNRRGEYQQEPSQFLVTVRIPARAGGRKPSDAARVGSIIPPLTLWRHFNYGKNLQPGRN